jgi:glycosyltransferase involved in cell wall biosynthesis
MSLRILHALRTVDPRAGKQIGSVCELLAAQRQFGHTVEVVALDQAESQDLFRLGVPVHRVGRSWGAYGFNPGLVRWLKANVDRYDCVIVHGVWSFNAFGTWLALRDSNVPYFVMPHGALDPWMKLRHPLNHLKRWLYWPWGGYPLLRDAHAVLFLSDDERIRARETFWLYDCHEFVVRFGIAEGPRDGEFGIDAFLDGRPELQGMRLFTYFAGNEPQRGIDLLLQALHALSRRGLWKPETMRLVIADPSPGFTRDGVMRAAAHLGLADSIHWAGPLNDDARWACLRASEAFLRPSIHETSGLAVAESLSAGTPVFMSTGVTFWKDVVNDGAGFADAATRDGIVRLMARALELTGEEREILRRKARRCFEERYTLDGAANTLTAAIYLLIGVHRDKRWDPRPLKPASELP